VPGRFITLEGSEGAGKTLQAERLADALRERGQHVRLTREPGGTRLGEAIRSIVLARGKDGDAGINARADALLFNAARAQLVATVIEPALQRGDVVVCDRYADSTLAYQGHGAGLPLDALRDLATFATGGLQPDLTILLDLPVEAGLARKAGEETRFEQAFSVDYHRRVRAGFLALAAAEPARFAVVDATQEPDAVTRDVLAAVDRVSWPASTAE